MDWPLTFPLCCQVLADRLPLIWRRRLFERLVRGEILRPLRLATGLGNTSVIQIRSIALAHSASGREKGPQLPPRLV